MSPRRTAPPQRPPSLPEAESLDSADGTDEVEGEEVVEVALPPTGPLAISSGKDGKGLKTHAAPLGSQGPAVQHSLSIPSAPVTQPAGFLEQRSTGFRVLGFRV